MGHWEQIGAERRRNPQRGDSLWTRLAITFGGCVLWALILLSVFR